ALPRVQVPHDGARRGGDEGRPARSQRGAGRPLQDRRRPARDARRAVAAQERARRAAAAPQHHPRRDEPRRPAPARRRGGHAHRGLAPPPAGADARTHRPLADPRPDPGTAARDGRDRLSLRRELVALDRHQDPPAHGAPRAGPPRAVTREDVADPAISVVVPAFNRETTLSVTLDSLLAQTYTAWEAIVVDDGSSDGTAALAERYAARDSRIRVHRQANAGVSGARNRGIELARAAWLFFLDADDWIVPTAFEALTDALAADPEADVAYGGYVRVDDAGREVEPERPKHEADFFPVFARTCAMAVHTCLVRAQLVRDVGGFDADLVTCEDWDLWQRIARMGARFVGVPDYIARYRLRLGSASGRGSRMLADGLRVIDRGHGDDPRLPTAPPRAPLPSGAHEAARTYYVCYAAGLEIAHGHDPCALLVEVGEGLSGDVDPHGVGETLFHAVAVGRACGHDGWAGLPSDVHRECDRFIDALGEEVGSHWLAHGARLALERLVLGVAREERPRTVGRWHLIQLDLAAEPPQDLALDGAVTRVICDVQYGDRPVGSVEVPVIDGWLPALVLADAIV